MALYFLHLHEGDMVLEDPEGCECASVEQAVRIAVANARDVMIGELRAGRLNLHPYFVIADSEAKAVARLSFRDAVEIV